MDRVLTIPWLTGGGNILVTVTDGGDVAVSSDTPNTGLARQRVVTFQTTAGGNTATASLTVRQKGARVVLRDSEGRALRDTNGLTLTALK